MRRFFPWDDSAATTNDFLCSAKETIEAGARSMAYLTPTVSGLSEVIHLFSETVEYLAIVSSTEAARKAPCQDLINMFEDLQATMRGVPTRDFDGYDEELYQEFEKFKIAANRLHALLSTMTVAMMEHLQQIRRAASRWPASHSWNTRKLRRAQVSAIIDDIKWKIAAAHQDFRTATEVMSQESFIAVISKAEADARVLAALPRISNAKIDHVHHRYLSGTMTTLLNELEAWIPTDTGRKSTNQYVWYLTGGAYTGKSTAAAEFCRRLAVQGLLGASFRCNDEHDNETKLLFPTLAVQLTNSQPALRQHIVSAAKDLETTWDVMAMEDICHKLLRDPLRALPKDHPPIYIVIDAFEECERRSGSGRQKELVTMLLRFLITCASGSCLRILLVSRPDTRYVQALFASPTVSPYIHHLRCPRFTETEVGAVFKDLMSTCYWGEDWFSYHPHATGHVAMQAQGWIGYANLAVSALLDKYSHEPRLAFFGNSGKILEPKTCFSLAGDIRPFYKRLARLLGQPELSSLPGTYPPLYWASILIYIPDDVLGRFQMTPRRLGILTGRSSTHILDILEPLRSIVIFENPYCLDSALHFLHPTLRDVLVSLDRPADQWPIPTPSEPEVAARLMIGCARMILSPLLAAQPKIPLDYAAFSEYAQQHPPPVVVDVGDLRYAFSYMQGLEETCIKPGEPGWNEEDVALAEMYGKLDSRTVDELFLWMCVTPRARRMSGEELWMR
ncbi:hypothetical protein C8Q80DRAFT_1274412 [Daedaleopsis nitida]|nr:hypothetical protein C8Q80DRAFT_1274412 [Daedaleopsis nitida]